MGFSDQTTNYKLQTTNYKLQTTNYKLQTTNYNKATGWIIQWLYAQTSDLLLLQQIIAPCQSVAQGMAMAIR
ncbi:hypothetical protein DKW60_21050 [Leucothrix pacifica]|uniref:Uncharacterized protein n=1 Tax=Leucothrix pacifica TaxID=1247513 RepID=A0A317C1I7_9GAMM|nr:hypothetical protein DKW60_21050 [Leucothrix pacifica]